MLLFASNERLSFLDDARFGLLNARDASTLRGLLADGRLGSLGVESDPASPTLIALLSTFIQKVVAFLFMDFSVIVPFLRGEYFLNLFDKFLQGKFALASALNILDEILVASEGKDITQDALDVVKLIGKGRRGA